MFRVDEKLLTRLFIMQCFLTSTYLISDFAFSAAPKELFFLLQFFELPGDAVNFERQAFGIGLRRFQSLSFFSQGFFFLLLVFFNLREFFSKRGSFLFPLAAMTLGIGLFSGQRSLILIVGLTLLFCAYAQRFLTLRTALAGLAAAGLMLVLVYSLADRMPLAIQRSVSFLPGVEIHYIAQQDGAGTMETRRILRQLGVRMIPQYFWLGRGFNTYADNFSSLWDPTGINAHIEQGKFYNGFIGLMINTGFPGTFFMLIFLGSGTILAGQIIRKLREQGCDDNFARVCCVVSGLWMANVLSFWFLHGDSEYAMKTFSLQAAILITCNWHLTQRSLAELPPA